MLNSKLGFSLYNGFIGTTIAQNIDARDVSNVDRKSTTNNMRNKFEKYFLEF